MNSTEKLILLADKLDREGLTSEAALVDGVIVKRSFDQEVRGDVRNVLQMTLQLLDELDTAVDRGVSGLESEPGSGVFVRGFSGAIENESLKEFYKDKISRIREATEHVQEFTDLTEEEGEPEAGPIEGPEEQGFEEEGLPSGEDENTPWWKFWSKEDQDQSAGPEGAPEGSQPDPAEGDPPEGVDEDLDGMAVGPDGTVSRTSGGRGIVINQEFSNIGNATVSR